jgi:hypothetical protein
MLKRLLVLLWILLSLPLLALSAGCMTKEEQAVRQVVTKYNENLTLALKRPQPELMNGLTTSLEGKRITTYLSYFYQQNKVMDSQLKSLEFIKVEIRDQKAVVRTKEQWSYKHLDLTSRKVVKPEKIINYQATYQLEKTNKKWVVASLEVKDDRKK